MCSTVKTHTLSKPKRSPNGVPTESQRSPNGVPTESQRSPNGVPTESQRSPNGVPTESQRSPNGVPTESQRVCGVMLNPRIYRWDRFRQIAGAFRQTFGDHPTQVKHRSTLVSFELRQSIEEWEWRVIQSMFMEGDEIPAPRCERCLHVYLLMFEDHPDHDALVRMREGRTPLDKAVVWEHGVSLWNVSPAYIQRCNQAFERRHVETKQAIRAWIKRWTYRPTAWKSRNRSTVCRDLRDALLWDTTPVASRVTTLEWIETRPVGEHPALLRLEDDIRANGL